MSFTGNKNLELPANGSYVGFWNVPMNGDMTIIDSALGGVATLTTLRGAYTLAVADYQPLILNVTGTLTANVTYTIPSGVGGQWIVNNQTTGAFTVTFTTGAVGGTTQTVSQGLQTLIASDGTDIWLVSPQTAAGSDRQVQFNNNGVLGASSNLVFNTSGDVIAGGTIAMASSFKRNRLINGNMGVWQRGTSGFTTNNSYCADRWIAKADTSFTSAAQSSDVPAGYQYSLTVTGTGYAGISQRIEAVNCYGLVGQSVTISFWAKQTTGAGANSLSVAIYYPTAGVDNYTGGVTQIGSTIYVTGTTSWAQYSVTFSGLPSGALSGLALYVVANVAGSSTVLLTGVQLEVGTVATPYEMQIYSDQLAQCQRYCYVSYSGTIYTPHAYGYAVTATSTRIGIQPAVTMRVAPSLTYSGNIGVANGSDSTVAVSALTIQDSGINMMTLQATTASSFFTIGQGARVLNVTDGSGKLILSAEL